jgi:threonine/homoserine/homoserine lactone efflux protein
MNRFTFLLSALVILFTPGPTNTLLLTRGTLVGFWRSLPSVGAEAAGYGLAITVLTYTLATFETQHVRAVLQMCCAFYLTYCSYKLLSITEARVASFVNELQIFFASFTNPKALIFVLVLLPPGTWTDGEFRAYALQLLGLIMLSGISWIALGSLINRKLKGTNNRLKVAEVSAAIMLLFGAAILYNGLFVLGKALH